MNDESAALVATRSFVGRHSNFNAEAIHSWVAFRDEITC